MWKPLLILVLSLASLSAARPAIGYHGDQPQGSDGSDYEDYEPPARQVPYSPQGSAINQPVDNSPPYTYPSSSQPPPQAPGVLPSTQWNIYGQPAQPVNPGPNLGPNALPDQFRVIEADSVILLRAIRDYVPAQMSANDIVAALNNMDNDTEKAVQIAESSQLQLKQLLGAQASVVRFLKNVNLISKSFLARKADLKPTGDQYFTVVLTSMRAKSQRLQSALARRGSPIVKYGSAIEFKVLNKELDDVLRQWML